jgi:hypothetical protein
VNYTQPNDVLWFLTMNQTKVSPDLASRGMPIRLYYEGDPSTRVFNGPNPLAYALEYRAQILAELFGFVELWKSRGRPLSKRRHRCEYWAQLIGGILEACGFPEFLCNAAEAAAEFNSELVDLAALAETIVRTRNMAACAWQQDIQQEEGTSWHETQPPIGLAAAEWLNVFRGAKVETERLDSANSARSRATIIGNFLARMVDRQVSIEVEGRTGRARLRSATGRSRAKLYYFEVAFDDQIQLDDRSLTEPRPAPGRKTKTTSARRSGTESKSPEPEFRESPIDRSPARGLVGNGNDEAW